MATTLKTFDFNAFKAANGKGYPDAWFDGQIWTLTADDFGGVSPQTKMQGIRGRWARQGGVMQMVYDGENDSLVIQAEPLDAAAPATPKRKKKKKAG